MATIIPALPGIPNLYNDFNSATLDNLSFIAGKIYRAVILINQKRGNLGPKPVNGENPNAEFRKEIKENQLKGPFKISGKPREFLGFDKIRIIDLDYRSNQNRFYDYLELPFIPNELSFNMDSKFVAIATVGRNNSFYHYTGSEDELEFTIDWFSDTFHVEDVIFNCRWLEALTKTDGYGTPHRVKIMWGKDDRLLRDDIWLLVSAPYKLSQFNRGYIDPDTRDYISTSLLPRQAYQTCKFKKISKSNLKYKEIMGSVLGGHTSSGVRPNQLAQGDNPLNFT